MNINHSINLLKTGATGFCLIFVLQGCSSDEKSTSVEDASAVTQTEAEAVQQSAPPPEVVLEPVPEKKNFLSNEMELLKLSKGVDSMLQEDAEMKKKAIKDAAN